VRSYPRGRHSEPPRRVGDPAVAEPEHGM